MRFLKGVVAAIAVAGAAACAAQESKATRAFDLMWESQWHGNGSLQRVVRWPTANGRTLRFSIQATEGSPNPEYVRRAVVEITREMGFESKELAPDDDAVQIQFEIKHFAGMELMQSSCYAQPGWNNWLLTRTKVVLSEQYAFQCVLHEMMHAVGFPGHPNGNSVLSYFEGNRLSLKPIDKFMLKAWYSAAILPGANAFDAVRALNRQWIEENTSAAERDAALLAERAWFQDTVSKMEAYAHGRGEPPTILYRSGRLSTDGMRIGLMNVQFALAEAYLDGSIGGEHERSTEKGTQLLLMAAMNQNRQAANDLAFRLFKGDWNTDIARPLCEWLKSTNAAQAGLSESRRRSALNSRTCNPTTP